MFQVNTIISNMCYSIRVLSNESALFIRWPKCWSFSFNISPSNKYLGLISFRIHWFISLLSKGLSSLPTPQFISFSSSVFSLLYGPTFAFIHNYLKNHSFVYIDFCQQSDLSAFKYTVQVCHRFSSKEQASFIFNSAVTICSDFGAQGNKICHCFYFFLFYLP